MKNIIQLSAENPGTVFDTLNQSSHAIWWAKEKGELIMANKCYIKKCGFRDLDSVQGSHYSKQPTEGGEFHECWTAQDFLTRDVKGQVEIISYLKFKGSDERLLLHCVKHPAYDAHGKWIGTVNHAHDITRSHAGSWLPFLGSNKMTTQNNKGAFTLLLTDRFQNKRKNISLTNRQSECLFLLLHGLNTREIAEILCLSYRTVEDHIDRLESAMNVFKRSDILPTAFEMGFLNMIPEGFLPKILNLKLSLKNYSSF